MLFFVLVFLWFCYSIVWKKKLDFWSDFWDQLFFRYSFGDFWGDLGGDFWRIFGGVLDMFYYSFGGF